ncbi:acylphosphatase [Candidatus Nitrososphaera evergladensis]|uniref:acylphosphatase n=1 Tax=Candidatus Nitrososphaera evergladensis TaxID=1459637 RepID=UPI001D038290|nr:acylphosphatase [Candidatus Nitrososphaera evergladensis]
MLKKTRAHVFVTGKVQGVYFRQNTQLTAKEHGVTGWVRNLPDGRVEAVIEGDDAAVRKVVDWCRHGPSSARVDNIEVKHEGYTGEFASFEVTG